ATLTKGTPTESMDRVTYTYDASTGKRLSETLSAYRNSTWVVTRADTYSYTSDGQLSAVLHADNTSIGYTYLPDGTVGTIKDENHTTPNTTFAYDGMNRVSGVTRTISGSSVATGYGYDAANNVTSISDPNGNNITYT